MMIYTQGDIESARIKARYELAAEIKAVLEARRAPQITLQTELLAKTGRVRDIIEDCERDMAEEMDRVFQP